MFCHKSEFQIRTNMSPFGNSHQGHETPYFILMFIRCTRYYDSWEVNHLKCLEVEDIESGKLKIKLKSALESRKIQLKL